MSAYQIKTLLKPGAENVSLKNGTHQFLFHNAKKIQYLYYSEQETYNKLLAHSTFHIPLHLIYKTNYFKNRTSQLAVHEKNKQQLRIKPPHANKKTNVF